NNCANLNGDNGGSGDIADTVLLLRKASSVVNCPSDTCVTQTTLAGCPGPTTLPTHITGNVRIPAGCDAHINGITFVDAGAILTVDPGVTIKGDITDPPSALVVKPSNTTVNPPLPSGRINAVGLPGSPITWTSAANGGSRQRADWGGVNLLG